MIKIKNLDELNKALDSKPCCLVIFSATWCGPCKMYKSSLEQLKDDNALPNDVSILIVDIDEAEDVTAKFNIRSVPTTIIFKKSQLIETIVGKPGAESDLIEHAKKICAD